MSNKRHSQYPLRMEEKLKERAQDEADKNRRSLNAELGLLIEEGFKWREMKGSEAAA